MKLSRKSGLSLHAHSAKLVLAALLAGYFGLSSIGMAEPTRANGQVFQLIGDLDLRVETIEAGLERMQHYSIGMQAFHPDSDKYYVNDSTRGAFARLNTRLQAPVHLPDGAIITQVVCYFYDADPDNDLNCMLYKNELLAAEDEQSIKMGGVTSQGDDAGYIQKVIEVDEAVDNFDYSYFVVVRPYYDIMYPTQGDRWGYLDPTQYSDPITFIRGIRISYYMPEAPEN